MYGVKRLNSLFTAAAVSPKRFFRSSAPVRSTRSSLLPTATARIMHKRKVLPRELSRNVLNLTCESSARGGVCDVYVIGTRHGSKLSCQQVKAIIKLLKPQVVFLEQCSERGDRLRLQNNKVASAFGVLPSAEFRVAYDEAVKYNGQVIFGDRPAKITLRRTWAKMPLWHMIKLPFLCFFMTLPENLPKTYAEMLELDVDKVNRITQELSKHIPTVVETIIHERDQYISATLLKVARDAVVGRAHLPGIQKNWKQPIEVEQLLTVPSTKIILLKGITIAAAIISGIYLSIKK